MIKKLRPAVAWFAGEMERQLRLKDASRGAEGWADSRPADLLFRLREELAELEAVLALPHDLPNARIKEAADVANFAMMLADVVRRDALERERFG